MNKILVQVYIPAVDNSYDVFIPKDSKLHEIIELMCAVFEKLADGYFAIAKDTVLCDKHTGTILNINMSVSELGLRNGSKLILI